MKRPSFQFYPGDWQHDAALHSCSVAARGLWVEMLCIMHQAEPYGFLVLNGNPIDPTQLARIIGGTEREISRWLAELDAAGVYSRNEKGFLYSRRMVRDEQLRELRADFGKEGGNPKLIENYNKPGFVYAARRSSDGWIKIGASIHPAKRMYRIRQQFPGTKIELLTQMAVNDMGAEEGRIHRIFESKKSGEWFHLDEGEQNLLLNVHLKANQTPSSSSSSSSSTSKAVNRGRKSASNGNGENPWFKSDEGIEAKGKEAGIPARPGESFQDWKRRIFNAINAKGQM